MKERIEAIKATHARIQEEKSLINRESATSARLYVTTHLDLFLDQIESAAERNVYENFPATAWLSEIPRINRKWHQGKTRPLSEYERDALIDILSEHFSNVKGYDGFMSPGYYHVKVML